MLEHLVALLPATFSLCRSPKPNWEGAAMSSKNQNDDRRDETVADSEGLNRRDFFVAGAAAGVGAAALSASSAEAQSMPGAARNTEWHYEADVVICGGGCAGITAAIRARDLGASVIVIDQNYDLGGRMLHSGAFVSLGGGDPIQQRDMAGDSDPEGYVTVAPTEDPAELDDTIELLFTDVTDWSIVDTKGQSPYRYNDRHMMRTWAENCPATRQFMMDNYVRFTRINGTHGGGGVSRARAPYCFLKLGDVTDIRAGTISAEDAGVADPERVNGFAAVNMQDASAYASEGTVRNGTALARPLEFSAREKGVQFILNRRFEEVIREEQFAGRVLGVRASHSPRHDPVSRRQLTSWWTEGNIDETREEITIKANKAVIIASGGHAGNPEFRQMFYPAMKEPAWTTSGKALLGDGAQDASGIIAGMKIGANMAGMQQNLSYPTTFHIDTRLGTPDAYTAMMPGHPTYNFRGSAGLEVGNAGFEEFMVVNQVGRRFFNEVRLPVRPANSRYPGGPSRGQPNGGLDHVPTDWRNCRHEWVREMYDYDHGLDAALAINEGSEAPDYLPGPIWAIMDSDAIERSGWELREPYVSRTNGYFFSADTIEGLAGAIYRGHTHQRMPLRFLSETVDTWNGYVDAGEDPEFERHVEAPMFKLMTPPFYALSIMVIWHDSYGGLRTDGNMQVIDLWGNPIPGLFAGGEAVGGFNKHGLGKGHVQGFIAGANAANA